MYDVKHSTKEYRNRWNSPASHFPIHFPLGLFYSQSGDMIPDQLISAISTIASFQIGKVNQVHRVFLLNQPTVVGG